MLVYPIPHAVTQARVQLVVDQTAKAPPHVIAADVLDIFTEKHEAERNALAALQEAQTDQHLDVKA